MTTITGQRLPFQEQIDFLKQKVRIATKSYDELSSQQHDKAFVVAGAMKADLLADLHHAVKQAVEQGQAFHQFQANFDEILAKRGWLNDETQNYKAWRAKIIYQTNLRTSHMAGRYKQMTDPNVLKARPYWRYRHNTVENPRHQHKAWDGLVLPADSPFWQRNFPPNGYGCRCTVDAINEHQLNAMGKSKPDELPKDYINDDPRDDFTAITGATWFPDVNKYPYEVAKSLVASNMRDGVFLRWLERIGEQVDEEIKKPKYENLDKDTIVKKLRSLDKQEQFPIAVIPPEFQTLLGVSTQIVMLSEYDAIKQAFSRMQDKNFTFDDYFHVQFILLEPLHILRETKGGAELMTIWLQRGEKTYMAVLQQTKTGKGLFLKSFRLADDERELRRALKNNAVILYAKE